jgi:hypothetical protein
MPDPNDGGPAPPAAPLRVSDDIPETSMPWRRWLTFSVVFIGLLLVQHFAERLVQGPHLLSVIHGLIALIAIVILAYMTGATLKEWVAMATALRALRANREGGER